MGRPNFFNYKLNRHQHFFHDTSREGKDILEEVWLDEISTNNHIENKEKREEIGAIPSRCVRPDPPSDDIESRPNNCHATISGRRFEFAYYHDGNYMIITEEDE